MAYNHAAYIQTTIMSVLAQCGEGDLFDLEVLVGDDGSSDETYQILLGMLQRYPEKIHLIHHVKNIGSNENMRILIAQARGDYIAHLDGDDYWLPEKVMRQIDRLASDPAAIACCSNAMVIDDGGYLLGAFTNEQPASIDFDYLVARGNFFHFSTLMYRASAKALMLSFKSPPIDYEIHLTLARLGHYCFVNQPLACYRWMSRTSTLRNQFTAYDQVYRGALARILPDAKPALQRQALAAYVLTTLMSQRHWLYSKEFWVQVGELRSLLNLSVSGLLAACISFLIPVLRMRLGWVPRPRSRGRHLASAIFPRL